MTDGATMPAFSDAARRRVSLQCSRMNIGLDALTEKRLKKWGGRCQRDTSELPFGQVAQAWAEAEAKQGAENEGVIRGAAGIRIVRVDLAQRAMVQQPSRTYSWFVADITLML